MTFFDVTVALTPDLPVWPGDPPIEIERVQSLENGDIARVTRLSCSTHMGTHVDPPFHFMREGLTLDNVPLDVLIGPVKVIDVGDVDFIDVLDLQGQNLAGISRLLFKTKNARFWPEDREFHQDFVYLSTPAAAWLVEHGIQLVGIDYLSIEQFGVEQPHTHWTLLGAGVVIIEGLDLRAVAPGIYELLCLPLKIEASDGAPARVVLRALN